MNIIRLKLTSDDDESQPAVDTFITPLTPVALEGGFGALEPPVSPVIKDFIIPLSDYKWNQIVEIQLSNDKKV